MAKHKKRMRTAVDPQQNGDAVITPLASNSNTTDEAKKKKHKRKRSDSNSSCTDNDNSPSTTSINTFASIRPPLSPSVLTFLSTPPYDFSSMTPVQATAIPLFLTHRDVFVRAVTGSGKTLAFVVPAVEMILRRTVLLKRSQVGALILEPTREVRVYVL